MNEETTAAAPTKMCEIGQVLNPSVIELLRVAPMNQVARAQVLAACLKPIPPELSEFEQIKDWIEANIDVNVVAESRNRVARAIPQARWVPPPTDQVDCALTVAVDCEDVEYGTCRYSVNRYGTYRSQYTRRQLMDMIRNSASVDRLVDSLVETSKEEADEDWPEMEWGEEGPDHDNHESMSIEDASKVCVCIRTIVQRDVVGWIQANAPAELARLQGLTPAAEEDEEEPEGEDPEDHVPEE